MIKELVAELAQARKEAYAEAVEYMKQNPQASFVDVGEKFGFTHPVARRLWRDAGFPARGRGRKAGFSPARKPTTGS